MKIKAIGAVAVILSLVIVGAFLTKDHILDLSSTNKGPIIFSPRDMLDGLWNYHKQTFLDRGNGRTVDPSRGESTTSEGQSYTMLRAVLWNDKPTFDRSWSWTQSFLQHKNDHLFSWFYTKLPNGNYGVSPENVHAASDADTDIALSLIFANDRWTDQKYLTEAQNIISDIWDKEVIVINGKPYLTADDIEKTSLDNLAVVNPSYYSPAAYKIFAKYDTKHDWNGLASNSYDFMTNVSEMALGGVRSDALPPDWVMIDKKTGKLSAPDPKSRPDLTTNYGFDAMRVPFRFGLDWFWNHDSRAKIVLSRFNFLEQQWQKNGKILTTYGRDGAPLTDQDAPAIYGGNLAYFMVFYPGQAKQIYDTKLVGLYSPDLNAWKNYVGYYDDSWAWFGMALYNNYIINLDQK